MKCQWLHITITAALFCWGIGATAQTGSDITPLPTLAEISYGVYIMGDWVTHTPEFNRLDGIYSCCPNPYPENVSNGFHAGLIYRRALVSDFIGEVRLGWRSFGTTLKQVERVRGATRADPETHIPIADTIQFEHEIDASLGSIDLETLIGYRLIGAFRAYTGISSSILMRKKVFYREHIINSPGVSYDTASSRGDVYERNVYDGTITSAITIPVRFSLGAGYSFSLDRNEHLFLEPQIFYTLGLNSIISQDKGSWYVNTVSFGAALRFVPLGLPLPPPVELPPVNADAPPLRPD